MEDYYFGGEQSGHIIFRDFATTGDGELTAVQLLSILCRKGLKLSEAARVIKLYPQISKNISANNDQKLYFYTNDRIRKILDEAKEALGKSGRVVVRPSGTEPLIRIMAEGDDLDFVEKTVDGMVADISATLSAN